MLHLPMVVSITNRCTLIKLSLVMVAKKNFLTLVPELWKRPLLTWWQKWWKQSWPLELVLTPIFHGFLRLVRQVPLTIQMKKSKIILNQVNLLHRMKCLSAILVNIRWPYGQVTQTVLLQSSAMGSQLLLQSIVQWWLTYQKTTTQEIGLCLRAYIGVENMSLRMELVLHGLLLLLNKVLHLLLQARLQRLQPLSQV